MSLKDELNSSLTLYHVLFLSCLIGQTEAKFVSTAVHVFVGKVNELVLHINSKTKLINFSH